ncbi:MAG TPA: EthD family reductase [Candidatus Baltobacteraceae bacterium]|nr:EthD family reductase [Verrucomicrobiae bacterium]HTX14070.1 EthD family reductase [Candidatus Baltobacteraceae bacterium]
MANVKLVVMYPRPKDLEAFEKIYQNEHVPLAVAKLDGKTKMVATKVLASPQGTPPFYRIAEVHFRTMSDLQACAASDNGKQVLAHAVSISSGGPPVFLVAEEETFTFAQTAGQ